MSALAAPATSTREGPYRGLGFFTDDESDAARFFGRTDERRSLITNIRTSRLTVLYAESGVGKSSLLRAGLTARLRELAREELEAGSEQMLVPILFGEWKNVPLVDFREAVAKQGAEFTQPSVERLELPEGRMAEVLRAAASRLDSTLLVILDQFEEHLGRVRGSAGESPFVTELTACLADRRLNANFLVGVREDAFGKVDDLFRDRVAGVHTNTQLRYLRPEAARDAIVLPVERVYNVGRKPGGQVRLGEGLVDEVLRQVRHGKDPLGSALGDRDDESPVSADDEIEAPFLQLVMQRLWEREIDVNRSTVLRLETFEHELGGARQIVGDHLDDALKALSSDQLEIATDLFKELLTASGTKLALTAHDLAIETKHDEDTVNEILTGLYASRVVRSVDPAPGTQAFRFEIFHDKLTEPILELLQLRRQAHLAEERKQAEAAQREAQTQAARELDARRKAEASGQRARHWTRVAVVIALLCGGLLIATALALISARDARTRANRAAARATRATGQAADASLSATAMADLGTRPDISLLLLLAAHQHASPPVAERNIEALLQTTQGSGTTGILHGHADAVESVAFDPVKDILASGSADRTIRLSRVARSGRSPLGPPLSTSGSVFGVAFSPDGRLLAAATFDEVELWSMSNGRMIGHYDYKKGRQLTSIAFSPNGHLVAMGTADGDAVLWDMRTRVASTLHVSRTDQVRSVAFRHDGRLLATASGTQVGLWRISDHARLGTLTAPNDVTAVAFSQSGNRLAATAGAKVLLWTLPANPLTAAHPIETLGPSALLYSVAFSPDGRMVAAGGSSLAELVDATTGRLKAVLSGPHGALYGIAFSRDGSTLAAGSADRTVHLWGLPVKGAAGLPIARAPGPVSSVTVNSDSSTVVAGGSDGRGGFLEFIHRGEESATAAVATVRVPYTIESVASDPGAGEVAAGTAAGWIELWRVSTHTMIRRWRGTRSRPVYSVAFNPQGSELASGGADGGVRLWQVGTADGPGRLLGRDFGAVYAVAFSPDGRIVASGSSDHTIHLWNLATRVPPQTIPLDDSVFGLAFSPDGADLAAAGADDTVRVWQNMGGLYVPKEVLLGHVALVRSVAFSPDGATLVSGDSDGSIRLWDVAGGQEIGSPFTVDPQSVESVEFSPDGRFFISGGIDRTIRQWRAPPTPSSFATLRLNVCAFLGAGLSKAEWDQYAPNIPYKRTCPIVTP